MESQLKPSELLDRLIEAYQCCSDCGQKYGTYRAGTSSVWDGTCDVCKAEGPVTEARDYGYLYKGINYLKLFR